MATNQVLSDDEKRAFIRDGYLILRGAVSKELVEAALQAADGAYEAGQYTLNEEEVDPVPNFEMEVMKHDDIAQVPRRSKVFAACEDLLGKGKAHYWPKAQIAFRQTDAKAMKQGIKISDPMASRRYHIDGGRGKYEPTGTPFTLLVGICLSPGQMVDENRGQFNAWPGSHHKLHPVVRERASKNLIKGPIFGGSQKEKPDIGDPIRVLLRPGDAVLAHQRLGHSGGINLHKRMRKNLYFRILHKEHDKNWEATLNGHLFTQYEGLHHLIDDM